MPRPARLLLLVVAAATLVLVGAPPAPAQEGGGAPRGTRLEVEAGYAGRYLGGRQLPVRVRVSADRLIRGTLEVDLGGQSAPFALPIEVPGGSAKVFVIVLPTPAALDVSRVRVGLDGAGDRISEEAEVDVLTDEELVGLMPGIAPNDLPAPVAFVMGGGTARFAVLDDDLLGLAPGSLEPLGTIVATADEIGQLDGTTRAGVLHWIERGGRLLIDAPLGTTIAGLPDTWQPGETGRSGAGLGEVRLTAGAAGAGRWVDILEPTPNVSISETQGFGVSINESVGDSVARDAGFQSLQLPWLLGFLAVYAVLAGPGAYFVLRRRRPDLGWVVIPALAIAFTAGSFVVGSDLRSGTRAAQGSVVYSGEIGARVSTVVGTVSRSGGDGTTRFPTRWVAGAIDSSFFGGVTDGAVAVSGRPDGPEATVSLSAGGFGVVTGTGPATFEGTLTIEAHSDGDEVVGQVRNDTPLTLHEIGVFVGRHGMNVGTLAPGETAPFRVSADTGPNRDPYRPVEYSVWPDEVGYDRPAIFDSIVNLALWNDSQPRLGSTVYPTGVATAVGWTRDYVPPVDVVGQSDPEGRSAIVGRATVTGEGSDGAVAPGAARRELVRGPRGSEIGNLNVGGGFAGGIDGSLFRFTLPAGADASLPFVLDVPEYIRRVEVWDGTAWQVIDDRLDAFFNGETFATRDLDVPTTAIREGVLWIRATVSTDFGVFDGSFLELHTPVDPTALLDDGDAGNKPGDEP